MATLTPSYLTNRFNSTNNSSPSLPVADRVRDSKGWCKIDECILAIDIGATKILAAVFSRGRILEETRVPTPRRGIEDAIRKAALTLAERSSCTIGRVGVASVGPLSYEKGAIVGAPNLGEPLVRIVNAIKPVSGSDRIVIANDAVASLWAEAVLGKARGLSDAVMIVMGTGIGGAAMVGGEPVLGRRGWAHELGHIVLDYKSPHRCGCGGLGHWEAIAGGRWLRRTISTLAQHWRGPRTPVLEQAARAGIDPKSLAVAASQGDGFARTVLRELARVTAAGIASVVAVFDPEAVFLAGGLLETLGPGFINLAREYYEVYALEGRRPRIEEASFGARQALVGAYAIAINTPRSLELLNQRYRGVRQ